jgi:hypothetical protein
MPTVALPRIRWKGRAWFVDFRLHELRSVEPPLESVDFSAVDDALIPKLRALRSRETSYGYIEGLDD